MKRSYQHLIISLYFISIFQTQYIGIGHFAHNNVAHSTCFQLLLFLCPELSSILRIILGIKLHHKRKHYSYIFEVLILHLDFQRD